ncbi:peptide deformylase [Rhodalgimonas zhirmunskyi]|uniref:Peptide deformylase n=1 Tax=Rhodalgimonas zhirmunskyi TaxID=2964767 RepID=A0AAJ1UGQ6_9RHOB|nr:peptide deformylase [Rhodoalgimonas zhirmunskyi]MDQ2095862.1 peptide deformylase [Rhodoalgimonas zhirmunskyi]
MSVLPILKWPDPRLCEVCAKVGQDDLRLLIRDMFETMYAAAGRGLAAPQVGMMKRLFVMDVTWKEGKKSPLVMIDPVIVSHGQTNIRMDEMCLSVPGVTVPVERPETVTVRFTDEAGTQHTCRYEAAHARVVQHEYDHLDGRLHFDRVPADQRAALETPYLESQS